MPPARCDLQSAARFELPTHVGEIRDGSAGRKDVRCVRAGDQRFALEMQHSVVGADDRIDFQIVHNSGLGGVVRRDEKAADAVAARRERHRQNAGYAADHTVERELADERAVGRNGREHTSGGQKREENRQVVHRPRFPLVGRSEVDGDAAHGIAVFQILHGRAHTVGGLLHGAVRQTHNGKLRKSAADVRFHLHRKAVQGKNAHAVQLGKHTTPPHKRCCIQYITRGRPRQEFIDIGARMGLLYY